MIAELNLGQTGTPRTVKAIEIRVHAALKDSAGRSGISFDVKITYPGGTGPGSAQPWSVPPVEYTFTILDDGAPLRHDNMTLADVVLENKVPDPR